MNRLSLCVGVLLALSSRAAIGQEKDVGCFQLFQPPASTAITQISILLDKCTGKTWQLRPVTVPPTGIQILRWFPISTEKGEYTPTSR
jgi:hypothetical protein